MASNFDPDAYLSAKTGQPAPAQQAAFNPDTYLAQKNPSMGSKLQAGVEGFGQGALAGYLPQVQSLVGGLIPDPGAEVDEKLKAEGFNIQQPEDTYLSRRDENIARQSKMAKDMPGSYYGGQVAGALATAPAVGGLVGKIPGIAGKGVSTLSRMGKAAAGGAIIGAAQNPGDVEGEINPVQADERLQNAKTGALFGAAAQGGAETLNKTVKVIRGIPDFIKDFAEKRGAAATGLNKSQAKAAIKADPSGEAGQNLKELGRYVLDNKLVKVGDTIEEVANRSGELKKSLGQKIGQVYDKAVQQLEDPSIIKQTEFKPKELSTGFLRTLQQKFQGTPQGQQILNAGRKLTSNFNQGGKQLNINQMQEFKAGLDDMIHKSDSAFKRSGQQTPGIEAAHEMRTFIKKRMDEALGAIDKAFGMTLGEDIKSLNKHYSMVSKVNTIAKDRLAGDMGNNFLSITDKMAGIGGATVGGAEGYKHGGLEGAIKGAAIGSGLGLVSKGMRTYGRPMMTLGADKTAGLLGKVPAIGQAAEDASGLLVNKTGLLNAAGSGSSLRPRVGTPLRLAERESDRKPAKDKK